MLEPSQLRRLAKAWTAPDVAHILLLARAPDLHSRRSYLVVRFWDNRRHGYRIYVSNRRDAERFIDALYVLTEEVKVLAELPEPERAQRIRTVERQRRELELEIGVSEGPESR